MEIDDTLPLETELDPTKLSHEAQAAHAKLSAVIAAQMQPPLSPRVANEVDAYGEPLPPPAAEVPSSK